MVTFHVEPPAETVSVQRDPDRPRSRAWFVNVEHHGWGAATVIKRGGRKAADAAATELLARMRGTCMTIGPRSRDEPIDPACDDSSQCPSDAEAQQ